MPLNPSQIFQSLPPDRPLWLALSGGLDSMVLLQLLIEQGRPFTAIHVNHQLSPNAGTWQQHCQQACAQSGIPLRVETVQVQKAGQGLEAAARTARYAAFARHMAPDHILLTAHHADDQAETLLLRLLRGTGVAGLAAMRSCAPLAVGEVWRPLLALRRSQLEAYARARALRWVEDESNADDGLARNYLRNQVMPVLGRRWPDFEQRWGQTAAHCAEAQSLLDELARQDLAAAPAPVCRLGEALPLALLTRASAARARNLLRYWLGQRGLVPEQPQLAELLTQLCDGAQDAEPVIQLATHSLRRHAAAVYLLPALQPVPDQPRRLQPGDRLAWGNGELWLAPCAGGLELPAAGYFSVRPRQGGERCHPEHRPRSQSLKKCLQEVALPPWLRDQLPLLYDDGALLAVGDLWCEKAAPRAGGQGWRLVWQLPQDCLSD